MQYQCPLCQAPLRTASKTWTCQNGHGFDVAREGYVHLLPVQHKKSLNPGDTLQAVAARRAFLDGGYYEPLRRAFLQKLAQLSLTNVVDIGCGEGYYTSVLPNISADVMGFDIAKPAVQAAAKRYKTDIQWLVASAAHIPVAPASVDAVTSLFSPIPVAEIMRILTPQGHVVVAVPASNHVHSLRAALFEQVRPHEPERVLAPLLAHFQCMERQTIMAPMTLNQVAVSQLVGMTPYAWKANRERRIALEAQPELQTEAQFELWHLQRIAGD